MNFCGLKKWWQWDQHFCDRKACPDLAPFTDERSSPCPKGSVPVLIRELA